MAKYRKKPVVIEAEQWNGDTERVPDGVLVRIVGNANPLAEITLEAYIQYQGGNATLSPGDWVITNTTGVKYPCKPDIFEATYEPVE